MTTIQQQVSYLVSKNVLTTKFLLIFGFSVTVVMVHVLTLLIIPAPFTDDAWLASRALSYVRTGMVFGPLDEGVINRFEGYWTFFPWLPTVIQSIGVRLFPDNLLLAVRSVSLVFGFLLLIVLYKIGEILGGRRVGLLTSLLTAVYWPFFVSSHLGRVDIIAATLGFTAIALYLGNKERKWWVGSLCGLCLGLAFEIHPHSIIFGPVILALFLLESRVSMVKRFDFWGFILGSFLGFLLYFFLHIASYPATYFALTKIIFANTHTPPLLTFSIPTILVSIKELSKLLVLRYPLLLISIWAAFKLSRSQPKIISIIIVINLALICSFVLFIRNKLLYYFILFTPAIDLMVATFIVDFLNRPIKRKFDQPMRNVLVGLIIVVPMILPITYTLSLKNLDHFTRVKEEINLVIFPTETIMANQVYWLALTNHEYYSWQELAFYLRFKPGSDLEEAFMEYKPDIFIMDNHIGTLTSDDENPSLYQKYFGIPNTELENILEKKARLVHMVALH